MKDRVRAKKNLQYRQSNCSNKVRCNDEVGVIAYGAQQLDIRRVRLLYYYKCEICSGFHLSKTPGTDCKIICYSA